jgi:CBS domain-containing protein
MDLPVIFEVVDTPEKITGIMEAIYPMVRKGLVTAEDVEILKYIHLYMNPLPTDRLVSEVMTRDPVTLDPGMGIHQAWKIMLETLVKGLRAIHSIKEVAGIITDEDLLERAGVQQRLAIAKRIDMEELERELHQLESSPLKVADVMTKPVVTVNESEMPGLAAARMVREGLKRLPVLNDKGRLVGMLSRLDVLRQVARVSESLSTPQLHHGAVKTVGDAMSTDVPVVDQDEPLAMIVEKFARTNSHR